MGEEINIADGGQTTALQHVTSSMISMLGYCRAQNAMYVLFHLNDDVYKYSNVDSALFEKLLGANSIGSFFNMEIKNKADKFDWARIGVLSDVMVDGMEAEEFRLRREQVNKYFKTLPCPEWTIAY